MKYYAYLRQQGEGCDYTIGCAQTLKIFDADSDVDAQVKLSDIIKDEYTGETKLEKVILLTQPIEFDLKKVYDELENEKKLKKDKYQHIKDLEDFERLRNKLGK